MVNGNASHSPRSVATSARFPSVPLLSPPRTTLLYPRTRPPAMSARGSGVSKKMRVTASPPYGVRARARGGRSPGLSKRAPPAQCGKNLRWTTVALARKMSTERERLSLHVADEVAAEAAAEALAASPGRDVAAIERNTRRRVYDALKVMVAVGAIARSGKSLRWVGVAGLRAAGKQPASAGERAAPLTNARAGARGAHAALLGKRRRLKELTGQLAAFEEHRKARCATGAKRRCSAVQVKFPFVMISARGLPAAAVDASRANVQLRFDQPFALYAETDIVTMLAASNPSRARRPRSSKQAAAILPAPVKAKAEMQMAKEEMELVPHPQAGVVGGTGSCRAPDLPFPTSPTTATKARYGKGNKENHHPNVYQEVADISRVKTEPIPVMSLVDGQALGLPVLDVDVSEDDNSAASDFADDVTALLAVDLPTKFCS